MSEFTDYSLDQFPLRDSFRQLKALFHYNALQQGDNNGIYVSDGYAAKLEYPLNEGSVSNAMERFQTIYESYLSDSEKIIMAVVPDKGYYLAEKNGYLAMDYEAMISDLQEALPWATYVDLTDTLTQEDYYSTDTHWRQEALPDTAQKLCEAMGVTAFRPEELTAVPLERPFYGVYYGQAALPMAPDTLTYLTNPILDGCTVYNYETGKTTGIYDMDQLAGDDPYEVFLSGAAALLTIENPACTDGRELVVFRDSFGSSIVPLLAGAYSKITLVDIRYVDSNYLPNLVDLSTADDVLFLYSAMVLNQSNMLK